MLALIPPTNAIVRADGCNSWPAEPFAAAGFLRVIGSLDFGLVRDSQSCALRQPAQEERAGDSSLGVGGWGLGTRYQLPGFVLLPVVTDN